jgi:hypothetical protein
MAASLRPVKPRPPELVLVAQFLAAFALAAAGLIAALGLDGLDRMTFQQAVGITAILLSGAAILSVSLARQMAPGSRQRIPDKFSLSVFAAVLLAGIALLFPWQPAARFAEIGRACTLRGLAVAVPGVVLFGLLMRRGAGLSVPLLGGTLGAMAGLLGVTVLQFRCVHQNASHLLVWHGGILAISAAAGTAIGYLCALLARNRA